MLSSSMGKTFTYSKLAKTLILFFIIFFPSCSKKNIAPPPLQKLTINFYEDPMSLDPRRVRTIRDLTLMKHLYEGLTREGTKRGEVLPGIAENITVSEDKLFYTFYLKQTFWNEGSPVTAHDFKESWLQSLTGNFPAVYAHIFDPIKNAYAIRTGEKSSDSFGVKVLSDYILQVELEKPLDFFLELVYSPSFFPVHESLRNSSFTNKLISNGPFYLEKWSPQNNLSLKKNSFYWDASTVKLNEILFLFIPDSNTELLMFQKGQLDWLGQPWSTNILSEALDDMKSKDLVKFRDIAGTFWLIFNVNISPLDRINIRKALSLAVNKKDIISHILKGNQKEAHRVVPEVLALSSFSSEFQNHNISKKQQLAQQIFEKELKTMGIEKKDFPQITFIYPSLPRCSMIAQALQQQWKEILGINVSITGKEYRVFLDLREKSNFHLCTGEWIADFNDPVTFLDLFKSGCYPNGEKYSYYSKWENKMFSSILEKSYFSSKKDRTLALEKTERMIIDDFSLLPLYHLTSEYALNKHLKNIFFSPLGGVDLKYAEIDSTISSLS